MRLARPLPVILAATVALLSPFADAAESVRFNRISLEEGLSQATVQTIVQDARGFVWVGTQQGLNRYDGYNFVNYFHDPGNRESLSHDWIFSLQLDARDNLWIGTEAGLNRLHLPSNRITRFQIDTENVAGNRIRAIAVDDRGWLWLGSDGGGVARFDQLSHEIKRMGAADDRVKALFLDAGGFLWIGTDGMGLKRFDPVSERSVVIELPGNDDRVRSIIADRSGDIWVATNERGLYRLDAQGRLKKRYTEDDGSGLGANALRVLFVDDEGRLWVGTDSYGVNRYEPVQDRFVAFRHRPDNHRSLSDDHVQSIYQDLGGVMWIGTYRGLNTWNPRAGVFSTFSSPAADGGLSNAYVSGFAEHPDGRAYVSTVGGGVNLVDLDTGEVDALPQLSEADGLSDDRVLNLAMGTDGSLWAGTRADGLNRRDPVSGRWRHYRHDPADPTSLSHNGVSSLAVDGDDLWVGTYGGGLNRYLAETDTFRRYQNAAGAIACSDRILALLKDRSGALWVATHGEGLCRLDPDSGAVESFRHDPADPASLHSDFVFALAEDETGSLWVGTGDAGISVWRAEQRRAYDLGDEPARFEHIGVADGLASKGVYALESDSNGRVWASGSRGLSRIDPGSGAVRRFGVVDGLQGNEFNQGASFRMSDGRLLFGGTDGFNAFYPHEIGTSTYAPPIVLTRFLRNNEPQPVADVLNTEAPATLRHTDHIVVFEYAALDFTDPDGISYRHMLEGFDEHWMEDANLHRATYTNLVPGDYRFRVQATNSEGVWSDGELTIPFSVAPAPWATWWARTCYVLALLWAVLLVIRYQGRKLAFAEEIRQVNNTLVAEITERQRKEAELIRSEQTAQRYLDVVEVIILALDADGRVTMVNQKGTRVLGFPEEDIVGLNFYDAFVPEEVRAEVRQRFQQVDHYAYSESPIKPKEGPERLIAWHTIPLPGLADAVGAGVLISGADVTQIRNLERQLRDAQKMEALGTLARGVAHDFNNILSSILGYAELSLGEVQRTDKVADYLRKLETSVDRARELIHGILTFGRGGGQAPRPLRVADAVDEALQLLKPTLGASVQIETRLDRDCGAVLADPSQLVQIVLNLCTNAGQAMGDTGGTITIRVSGVEVGIEEARSTAVLLPGPHVALVISDDGPGMDDFTLSRIFDPFFTTRRRDEGTGLGLAVVHGIVTQLKGTVTVTSNPGAGTRFEIRLPCCAEPAEDFAVPAAGLVEDQSGSEVILFVDDEASVRAIAEEALGKLGYQVILAGDGQAGLEAFRSQADAVDVVVTDQTMPGMLGHRLAEEIRAIREDVPIILMSGAGSPTSEAVDHFMDKPFTLSALGQAVRAVLRERSGAD